MYKKLILIDLDGVLNNYIGNYDKNFIPDLKSGAKEFLKDISRDYLIKVFTTRNLLLTSKWLIINELDEFILDVTNIKEPAYLYIDDRCINFNGDFEKIKIDINKFKVYWQQS